MRLYNGIYSAGNLKRTMLNKGKGEKRTIKMWTLEFKFNHYHQNEHGAQSHLYADRTKTSFFIFIY